MHWVALAFHCDLNSGLCDEQVKCILPYSFQCVLQGTLQCTSLLIQSRHHARTGQTKANLDTVPAQG